MTRYLVAALVLGLSGCASQAPLARQTRFVSSEYAFADSVGSAVISGQAFAKTRDGEVKKAAGTTISLTPVTTYSTEWFARAVMFAQTLAEPDSQSTRYERTTVADAEGRFSFSRVPAGRYFVTCNISWQWGRNSFQSSEVNLGAEVPVGPGERAEVILKTLSGRDSKFDAWWRAAN